MSKASGIKRIIKACRYTRDGLLATFITEAAFRQELLLAAFLFPLAFFIAPDGTALALMIASLLLVLVIELINSAIEAAIDLATTEIHPLAKKAKDAGSAAVFIALANVALVWLICLTY